MKRQTPLTPVSFDTSPNRPPSPQRPVRSRARSLAMDTHIAPHQHPWSQFTYCASGLMQVTADEISRADTQDLGVPMPHPSQGDKRLRALCKAVLRDPSAKSQLREWVADVGASERTVARLFRSELGTSYQQWRTQAVLAHALPQLARGLPIAQVAAAAGYASDSAFSAMFKHAMGKAPSHFQTKPLHK
jgi:AraC-like DNA-binding protein